MSKEELLQKNKEEVRAIAKGLGIVLSAGGKRKLKEELIEEILKLNNNPTEEKKEEVKDDDSDWVAPNTTTEEKTEKEEKTETEFEADEDEELTEEERLAKKKAYIENAKIGALVAFKSGIGKVKSAKIVKRSTKDRKFKVETKYGAQFIISFDEVIWVRTNRRWPKGVYQLLKGVVIDEETK